MSFFHQISRLTWFTRFDPLEPKVHIFSVEQSSREVEMSTTPEDEAGGEHAIGGEKVCPNRKGASLLCLSGLFHLSLLWVDSPTKLFTISSACYSPDRPSSASSIRSKSRLMTALYWLCGMERQKAGENNVTPPAPEQAISSLEEKPRLQHIVNTNLIICLSVTAFIVGYWAWQVQSFGSSKGTVMPNAFLCQNTCQNMWLLMFISKIISKMIKLLKMQHICRTLFSTILDITCFVLTKIKCWGGNKTGNTAKSWTNFLLLRLIYALYDAIYPGKKTPEKCRGNS